MKHIKYSFLLTILMSMVGAKVFAHDIAVANADGVTIYYNYIKDNTELRVTFQGTSYNEYSNEYKGKVVIPSSVNYNDKDFPVTSIGSQSFWHCTELTSITIPTSVTNIGYGAFFGCI